ncbi:MAG: ArsC family reductase [Gammaproteobacteria bacterium]|nr:ArsC family reductase [Gammaproteobacteria bacterium]
MTSSPVKLYGIANCDRIRKARNWLDDRAIVFDFHDYRKQGVDMALLQSMAASLGWEVMLNRRGTTWRALPEAARNNIDRDSALQLMLENPAIIKRPILDSSNQFFIGFNERQYQEIFDQA